MPDICEELQKLLTTVRRPGDFYASGRLELLTPRLAVEGVGQIALPLLPVQAEQLIAVADRAPYGRGSATIVDTSVRRTWQIEPAKVRLGGKHWEGTLERLVTLAADGLGVSEPVSAKLYKLLIYDEGSFFLGHRDTEKDPGMFATLVLALPSQSSGGELVVRHKGREAKLDLASSEPSEMAFAAFYADCVHEVLPVTAGCRATLIYNLARKGKGGSLEPPSYEGETARAETLLLEWASSIAQGEDDTPEKVVYLLEHAYSAAELDFAKLKGADAAAAALLRSAAPRAACDLHLALVTIEESGSAEYNGSYRRRSRRRDDEDDDDEFEVVEVHDRRVMLTEWRRPDGTPTALGHIPIEDGEVSPPDALEALKPDEEHFHEATGNEGASFERTYRRAALVLWPQRRRLAVINQAGPDATVPYLESLAQRWIDEGEEPDSPHWIEAHALCGHMLSAWPTELWYGDTSLHAFDQYDEDDDRQDKLEDEDQGDEAGDAEENEPSWLARVLAALAKLRDETRIVDALGTLAARRGHAAADNDAILGALALFPLERAAGVTEDIIANHAKGGSRAVLRPAGCGSRGALRGQAGASRARRHTSGRLASGRSGARTCR